jgi:predicted nucleic acid-binding protein
VTETLVLDASAMVALLVGRDASRTVAARIRSSAIHVPAHFDAEVLSALGRLHRAGEIDGEVVSHGLDALAGAPFERHALAGLVAAAWRLRDNARLVDALYIALSSELSAPIVTFDRGLAAAAPQADLLALTSAAAEPGSSRPAELVDEDRPG